MRGRRAAERLIAPLVMVGALLASSGCGQRGAAPAAGADTERPATATMKTVKFIDVAADVGLDFRHGAFRWETTGDPNAMMGGGLCWIDVDDDGWLDLFAVNTWSQGEWGRWRREGALPTTRLYRNERGRFSDVTEEWAAGLEVRGNGCVAADLDLDGRTDLYVTTERDNFLLWNDGDRFELDDGTAGANAYGWQSGAAAGDVDGNGWPDLFVAGYADMNNRAPNAGDTGFPTVYLAEPDLLLLNQGPDHDGTVRFLDGAAEAGIEPEGAEHGLGAVLADLDADGDLDLHVANDTTPNQLYENRSEDGVVRFVEVGESAGVDDEGAGMGIAVGDADDDGLLELVVTNQLDERYVFARNVSTDELEFRDACAAAGVAELGAGFTGWGASWVDLDLDGDLDLVSAQGAIPVRDLVADREDLLVFENRDGRLVDVGVDVGVAQAGPYLGRGLAAADYDNDGDVDLAVGTIGGDLALLRNTGAGGNWLVVDVGVPGAVVTVERDSGRVQRREVRAGGSYLSSEDPRVHIGLGATAEVPRLTVEWLDGTATVMTEVEPDRIIEVRP